jgi:hypothetical protein
MEQTLDLEALISGSEEAVHRLDGLADTPKGALTPGLGYWHPIASPWLLREQWLIQHACSMQRYAREPYRVG